MTQRKKRMRRKRREKKPQIAIAVSDGWYVVLERCRADKRKAERERSSQGKSIFFAYGDVL